MVRERDASEGLNGPVLVLVSESFEIWINLMQRMFLDCCHCELDCVLQLDSKWLSKIPILSLYLITGAVFCNETFLL